MVKCFKCGNEVNEESTFCGKCGCQLKCPNCGAKIDKENDFCEQCGSNIKDKTNNRKSNEQKNIKKPKPGKIVAIIIVIFIILGGISLYIQIKNEMTDDELRAYWMLHASGYNGGELSQEHLNNLKKLAKRVKSNSEWFKSDYGFSVKNADTDKYDITYLCNDSYCAKFTVYGRNVVSYEFSPKKETGYKLYIVKEYSKSYIND